MARALVALLSLAALAASSAAPRAAHAREVALAQITAAPQLRPTRTSHELRRGIISDISTFAGGVGSALESLGSAAASYVTSELAVATEFLDSVPGGSAVASSLGGPDLSASPIKVLNIPAYGNWTNGGWNMRFRANAYKNPNLTQSKLDDLANDFLIGTSVQDLSAPQQTQARNLTAEIFVVQQGNVSLTFSLAPAASAGSSGEPGGGGAATPPGGNQTVKFPVPTIDEGDIDGFVHINGSGLSAGNDTTIVQRLSVYSQQDPEGNATSFLVPPKGLTVVSDIDDILRVTKIWDPKEGIFNTFAAPFTPWMNMQDVYSNWSRSVEGTHFHYLTTTPEQITRNYMDFIYKHYPGGSFDTRPLNFSDISATISIRKYLLQRVFETFPNRSFVLVADTSNSDVMRDYPAMATDFPGQVQCILLRNTSATDSSDELPYDTSGFQGLDNSTYMFFRTPDDLMNLDIASGHCVNSTFKQNITFGYQGLPLGLDSAAARPDRPAWGWIGAAVAVIGIVLL